MVNLKIKKCNNGFVFLTPQYSGFNSSEITETMSSINQAFFQDMECVRMFENTSFDSGYIGVDLPERDANNAFTRNRKGNYCLKAKRDNISFIKYGNKLYSNMEMFYYDMNKNNLEDVPTDILLHAQRDYKNLDNWDANRAYGAQNDQLIFDLYIFQKGYAYTGVYYAMFDSFISKLKEDNPDVKFNLNVFSIGCGAKTDALALKYATSDYSEIIEGVNYIGIDPGKWNINGNVFYYNDSDIYVTIPSPEEVVDDIGKYYIDWECDYIRSDVFRSRIDSNNRTRNGVRSINMVVFPNMLSELNPTYFEQLLGAIKEVYTGCELYLLTNRNVMFKYDGKWKRKDDEQVEKIENYNVDGVHFDKIISETAIKREMAEELGTLNQPGVKIENTGNIYDCTDANDICNRYSKKVGNVQKYIRLFNNNKVGDGLKCPNVQRKYMQYEVYEMVEVER